MDTLQSLLFPVLLVLIIGMMFFVNRKQRKTVNEQQQMQNSLEKGDRVMTTSGLYGTVVATATDTIDLEIADGVVTTWLRLAVREKVQPEVPEDTQDTALSTDAEDTPAEVAAESHAEIAEPLEHKAAK